MKTIRENVFETNSSSTHSVTISRRSEPKVKQPEKPLVDKGTLYPNRLHQFSTEIGYDGSNISCDTKDKKAAIVAQWILGAFDNEKIEEVDYKSAIAKLREACGYLSIDFEGMTYPDYSSYDDNEGNVFSLTGDEEDDRDTIERAIRNVLDDDIVITDTNAPY